jgi:hypothetical protein
MYRPLAVLVASFATLISTSAFAAWPDLSDPANVEPSGADDVALIVSIEDYAFLPDIAGATQNAAAWERFLRRDLGVKTVLVLKDQQAVREEILQFAKRAAGAANVGGRVWFVFIGHGAPNKSGDDGLLIGADGQQTMSSMMARSVSRAELLEVLKSGKQADTVALLDACFSGRDATGSALAKGVQPVLPVNATLATPDNTAVLTAASANEVAGQLPDAERPAFSYLVLGAMRGWADDGDGEVTVDEAVSFARSELLGVSGRQQTPQLDGASSLVLSRGASESRPDRSAFAGGTPTVEPQPTNPPAGDVTASTGTPATPPTPGKARSPFYALGGLGVSSAASGASVLASADLGVKLNVLLGLDTEWRLGVQAGYFSYANPDSPSTGDTVPFDNGDTIVVDSGDSVNDTRVHMLKIGAGPGIAFRGISEFMMPYIHVNAGLATGLTDRCTEWTGSPSDSFSSGGRDINCTSPQDASAGYAGVRAGAQFGFIDVAAHADILFGTPNLMVGATLGLALDR